jgi:hypothetical protein
LSRFIAPAVLVIALLGAAPASAGLAPKHYTGQVRLGSTTSSRFVSGSCSAAAASSSDLVLRCDNSSGKARAKYTFTLPRKAGSVMWQVNFRGRPDDATLNAKRISDTEFRVSVTQDVAGRADIASVTIEYYVCG